MPPNKPGLWGATDTYENYMGRWSRKIAPLFLEWLGIDDNRDWIDVGCGTGELSAAVVDRCNPAALHGVDPAEGYIDFARNRLPQGKFAVGSALELDKPDDRFDVAVSGLVLNFVPDANGAISEMVRVVKPGGIVASYVWDYAGHMQIMRYFFDTAAQFDAGGAAFDDGIKAPICRPEPLRQAFNKAGLADVTVDAVDIPTPFASFDEYWAPFLAGTGSAPKYCVSLDENTRGQIRDALRARLPTGPDGEILLAARAWAVRGAVPV